MIIRNHMSARARVTRFKPFRQLHENEVDSKMLRKEKNDDNVPDWKGVGMKIALFSRLIIDLILNLPNFGLFPCNNLTRSEEKKNAGKRRRWLNFYTYKENMFGILLNAV